jgi:hypothetical protein
VARPDTHPGVEGGGTDEGANETGATPAGNAVPPGTGVVRPGTGVVRPGTGVVRPGVASTTDAGSAKASAAVPDAPEKPLEPIHIVLPVIPVKPAKQGFLDRLVAPKPKKTEAEIAEEEARREAEEARKAEEAHRKTEEKVRKAAEDSRRAAAEADAKAEAKAEEKARKEDEKARKAEEAQRKAEDRARRAEAKAREQADEDQDDDAQADEPISPVRSLSGPAAPPISPPARPSPPGGPTAPPRPIPTAPPRPGARPAPPASRPFPGAPPGARPQRHPSRRTDIGYDRRVDLDASRRRRPLWHWIVAAAALIALGSGSAAVSGAATPPATAQYAAGVDTGEAAPILGGLTDTAPRPTTSGLAAAVGPLISDVALGPSVAGSIVDASTGDTLYDVNGSGAITPASSAKLLTAAAVLQARGPNYRIPTRSWPDRIRVMSCWSAAATRPSRPAPPRLTTVRPASTSWPRRCARLSTAPRRRGFSSTLLCTRVRRLVPVGSRPMCGVA